MDEKVCRVISYISSYNISENICSGRCSNGYSVCSESYRLWWTGKKSTSFAGKPSRAKYYSKITEEWPGFASKNLVFLRPSLRTHLYFFLPQILSTEGASWKIYIISNFMHKDRKGMKMMHTMSSISVLRNSLELGLGDSNNNFYNQTVYSTVDDVGKVYFTWICWFSLMWQFGVSLYEKSGWACPNIYWYLVRYRWRNCGVKVKFLLMTKPMLTRKSIKIEQGVRGNGLYVSPVISPNKCKNCLVMLLNYRKIVFSLRTELRPLLYFNHSH